MISPSTTTGTTCTRRMPVTACHGPHRSRYADGSGTGRSGRTARMWTGSKGTLARESDLPAARIQRNTDDTFILHPA